MITTHTLGYPRVGAQRQLKFALEAYWAGRAPRATLTDIGAELRRTHWHDQAHAGCTFVPVGDFSFYDHVLDMSFTLGHLPQRVQGFEGHVLDNMFRVARGRSVRHAHAGTHSEGCCGHAAHGGEVQGDDVQAGEMTKWFDTNYHHIVPEFDADTTFALDASRLLDQLAEARAQGHRAKPVIIGPVTYLWLGKARDGSERLALLDRLLPVYAQLLDALAAAGATWVQIDEPVLCTELDEAWRHALRVAYHRLHSAAPKLLLTAAFGPLRDQLHLAATLPTAGLHVDATTARDELPALLNVLPSTKVLSLGVVSARNIWATDLNATLTWLRPVHERLGDRLWLAPGCSLLHVPVDLAQETQLDPELRPWLAFARQKLDEVQVLATALRLGPQAADAAPQAQLSANREAIAARHRSPRVHRPAVQEALSAIGGQATAARATPHRQRAALQAQALQLPAFPTTTIGSFPQTAEIRATRAAFKRGELDATAYDAAMRAEIAQAVAEQESLGLDVLVHGEAERNDMVEYFGELLDGYLITQHGWVQSYGSRCVKPPILYGDVQRRGPMTVAWTRFAQSLTTKPMKGMLTGPVTMLNWSFVRDDQPRALSALQLALAIRDEVLDLEAAGVRVIQIDEAALREGLPLRRSDWAPYLDWAVAAFRLATNGVRDSTQVHTHMCYSEFNDIIGAIAAMDADVITIETARSQMALLDAFERFAYPNDIGPGVYDIHSPKLPDTSDMVALMQRAARHIPPARLWVNPDCGLKTRRWDEVRPALARMVAAAQQLRTTLA